MRKLGVLVRSDGGKFITQIKEEDVTSYSVNKIQIEQILQGIQLYEENLNGKLNLGMIESLTQYYQQAIEYFSAQNDERFQEFLSKMHQLLQREDAQIILSSKAAQKKFKALYQHKQEKMKKEIQQQRVDQKVIEEEKQIVHSYQREQKSQLMIQQKNQCGYNQKNFHKFKQS